MEETSILDTACIPMVQNVTFKTEAFKESYIIQFPADYSGEGLVIGESASFIKRSPSGILFTYEFLSPIDGSLFFGEKLAFPSPDQLQSPSHLLTLNLPFRKDFCMSNDVLAILYYSLNENSSSFGNLYMFHKDGYYEGLEITFQDDQLEEVIEVIRTIKKN